METVSNLTTHQSHETEETSNHVISIDDALNWIASVEDKMRKIPKLLSNRAGNRCCCIFRVPQSFVQINGKAYHPQVVSIGPYHHGKQHLNMIQEHKWRFLGAILARTRQHGVGLNEFFNAIAPLEEKIRDSYSEVIECDSHDFVEMMILDGCFIIEVLCIVGRLVQTHLDDPIFNMSWMFSFLMRDFLRLENQIPFFVLESLFELILSPTKQHSLNELALGFFDYAIERQSEVLKKYKDLKGNHLLDLFRSTFIPQSTVNVGGGGDDDDDYSAVLQLIQSAKKLRLSGIKFKPRKADSFLDIKFSNGVLKIPPLILDDFTSYFLLNCVAFEQCYKHCSKQITSYVTFMSCLVNNPDDAGYLNDHWVIENYFGTDDEVVKFFNDIGKDTSFDIRKSYLSKTFRDVNKYYRNSFHVKWAGFKHTYFDSPWSFMSAMAALILLLLTMVQAFFAVYPYADPSHKSNN